MNSIYVAIKELFIPIKRQGNASVMNSFSIVTASFINSLIFVLFTFFNNLLYNNTANSVCSASSREISSFENVRPGNNPRFFNQKILQNAPEKNIPSTQANATKRVAKLLRLSPIHFFAQSAFFFIQG